jgi:hypothetical protein
MPRDWRAMAVGRILEDRVAVSFPYERAPVTFQMVDQITTLHGEGAATENESCCPACTRR